ncbi:MAG: hypothetical protein Q9164_002426 [Protoblastenia rupestris]
MLPLQQIKPKNARSKRALLAREPQQTENPKTALFLRYTTTSSLLTSLLTDLHTLKKPHAIRFTKPNPIHPFEDASSLEFFSQKNDASLLLFASHSKKRPHALTWVRCFGGRVLDMLELCVVQDTARTIAQFKGEKVKMGLKPMLSFSGTAWDSPSSNEYTLAKSMFVDFFRGGEVSEIDVEGLSLLISFFVGEEGEEGSKPLIQMRCWRLVTKRSGGKVPRVEVEEIGPRIDFRVGRVREADQGVMKEALKRAKGTEVRIYVHFNLWASMLTRMSKAKPKKNVETDLIGDKIGRIHLGKQDLKELQTRKMKGLKRGRDQEGNDKGVEEADIISEGEDDGDGVVETKRTRIA